LFENVTVILGNDPNVSKFDTGWSKRRLNSGNACYPSIQDLLSSRLLLKNSIVQILYKTIVLPVVLYGRGLWHWKRNIGWRCLRTGRWRKYLDWKWWSGRRMEKPAWRGAAWFLFFAKYN
jgi:hypothetical protein